MTRIKLVDISKPYYATRRFTMDGIEYQQDDRVPFDGLNERDIARLIKSTYVTSIEPKKAAEPVKAEPVAEPVKAVAEPVVDENARTGKLAHVGGGQYEVQDEDGANMLPAKVKGKDMARMAAGQMGITVAE
ncbi:hypothetical protein NVP1103O_27 [Vibrio phage 1.103.O._10N.261.52.F2]|nr:hypothetical protein NVP1103O_27 [Vibrio phage 1.103.O._10N.261.52.F2]